MFVWKKVGILAVSLVSFASIACGGSDGAQGPAGAAGEKGDKGDTGPAGTGTTPSVGVIVPNIGLLDRELDVTVTAEAVDFTAATPSFDFGAGVKTSNVQVLSATTAYVHLAVDAGAATGARDVKVTAGSNNLTSKNGFKVAAPITVTATPSALVQGGLAFVDVANNDTQHAFDTAGNFVGVFSDGAGVSSFSAVTATQATGGIYHIDPKAAASAEFGAANLDADGNPTTLYSGGELSITARAATALTVGTPLASQNLASKGATGLYSYSTSSLSILEVEMEATGTGFDYPLLAVHGSSGKFADLRTAGSSVVYLTPATADTAYAAAFDDKGGGGTAAEFGYSITATAHTATAYAEPTAAHDTITNAKANAVVTALPNASTNNGIIITGALATATEEDWYAVTVAAGDSIEIAAAPGFDATVDFTDEDGNGLILDPQYGIFPEPISTGEGGRTGSYLVTSDSNGDALPAGKYYVHVTSADGTAKGNYLISLRKR